MTVLVAVSRGRTGARARRGVEERKAECASREIAEVVASLSSDAASGITGHPLMVEGEYSAS